MKKLINKTDEFISEELSKRDIGKDEAKEVLSLIQEIRGLRTINKRVLNMLNGQYPRKEDGALKEYTSQTITVTGVFISSNSDTSLFRAIQLSNKKIVDHLWLKVPKCEYKNGDYVEITGEVNKYLGKKRTYVDWVVQEQYGIINVQTRLLNKQIFQRD